jgi:hypothetical protein
MNRRIYDLPDNALGDRARLVGADGPCHATRTHLSLCDHRYSIDPLKARSDAFLAAGRSALSWFRRPHQGEFGWS